MAMIRNSEREYMTIANGPAQSKLFAVLGIGLGDIAECTPQTNSTSKIIPPVERAISAGLNFWLASKFCDLEVFRKFLSFFDTDMLRKSYRTTLNVDVTVKKSIVTK
jgi:hypothetical protein